MGATFPSCSQNPSAWYCMGEGETYGQSYNGNTEHGNDLNVPFHTPVTLPYGGTITDVSYHGWGGQIGVLTSLPGVGKVIEYIQHLDLINPSLAVGQQIASGTQVGLSGGENTNQFAQYPGAVHPNNPLYSSGPHIEFGFNAPWIAGLSQATNQGSFNSQGYINAIRNGGVQMNAMGSGSGGTPPQSLFGTPWYCVLIPVLPSCIQANIQSIGNIPTELQTAGSQFSNGITTDINTMISQYGTRAGLFAIGLLLLIIGVVEFL